MNDLANSPMTTTSSSRIDFNTPELQRKRRLRALKDHLTRWYVFVGGLAVLATITLIFFYLAYVVMPLFQGAELSAKPAQSPAWLQDGSQPLLLTVEEQNQIGLRISAQGEALFFTVKTGAELKRSSLPLPAGTQVTSLQQGQPGSSLVAVGLSNGQALVLRHAYKATYPDGKKTITPELEFPYGVAPLQVDPQGRALEHVNLSVHEDSLMLAGSSGNQLHVLSLLKEENMFTGEVALTETQIELPQLAEPIKAMYIDARQNWLFVLNGRAHLGVFNLAKRSLNGRYELLQDASAEVTTSAQLLGGISLMIGDSKGNVSQWFMARDRMTSSASSTSATSRWATAPFARSSPKSAARVLSCWTQPVRLGCSTALLSVPC